MGKDLLGYSNKIQPLSLINVHMIITYRQKRILVTAE